MKFTIYPSVKMLGFASILIMSFNVQRSNAQQFLTTIDGWNAYVHLPDDYTDSVGKKYPLICFIPGTGEVGTNPSLLLTYGPSKFVAQGNIMQFMVNGKLEKPIVVSLQPSALWPNAYTLNRKLDTLFARYRCDQQRINVTGLSMGGWSWDNYVDNYSPVYTNKITSIVSMSAPEPDNTVSNMRFYALGGGTMWSFEGNLDLRGNDKIRDTMNSYVPGSNRYTLYSGGHCCWNTFYDPAWMENGESIYTWMLKQKKALIAGPVSPQAYAGKDSTIAATIISYSLKGSGNDPNGLLINFSWSELSGPTSGTITNPNAMLTSVSGLGTGIYKFELKVTNTVGLIGKDTLTISNGIAILPVTLTDFFAKTVDRKTVMVQWKTSSEINADHFVVEKGTDGIVFSEAGRQAAKASFGYEADYRLTDYLPENGVNYYRLKMVDKDGKFSYSKVVSVNIKYGDAKSIAINYADIKSNLLQLNINSFKAQQGGINIIDAGGKKLYSTTIILNKGINNFNRSISLPAGVYYANLISGNEKVAKAFIIK